MLEQQLHEIEFKDENHYNLYVFSKFLGLNVINPGFFEVTHQEWNHRYKVSIGNYNFYVIETFLPKLWLVLRASETWEFDKENEASPFELISDKVYDEDDKEIYLAPAVGNELVTNEFAFDGEFFELIGENYTSVEQRIEGLDKAVGATIKHVAKLINKAMENVARDVSIVKDFDGIITFTTPLGADFKLQLCLDKVAPIHDNVEDVLIERTPITEEDLNLYLKDDAKKVLSSLENVNELVRSVFRSKAVKGNSRLLKYSEYLVNTHIVKTFVTQTINFISFGGVDNWSSRGKETPNNKACFVFLDQEVDKLLDLIDSIPKEEGVDTYSIDIETFGIFGRRNNKVVTPAVPDVTAEILKHYSQGFERVLSLRLAQLDTPRVFKA